MKKLNAGLHELLYFRRTHVPRERGSQVAFLQEARADLESLQSNFHCSRELIEQAILGQPFHAIEIPRLALPLYWLALDDSAEPITVFFTPHRVVVRLLKRGPRSPASAAISI